MTSPGFAAVKSTSTSGFVLILPESGQKVKLLAQACLK